MSILHDAPGSTNRHSAKHAKGLSIKTQMSSPHKNHVGSGSRPTKSMHQIQTTSPHHPRMLDSRHVPGALGVSGSMGPKHPTKPHGGMKMKSK